MPHKRKSSQGSARPEGVLDVWARGPCRVDAEQYVHYFCNRVLAMKPLRVWRVDCVENPEDFLREVQRGITVVSPQS